MTADSGVSVERACNLRATTTTTETWGLRNACIVSHSEVSPVISLDVHVNAEIGEVTCTCVKNLSCELAVLNAIEIFLHLVLALRPPESLNLVHRDPEAAVPTVLRELGVVRWQQRTRSAGVTDLLNVIVGVASAICVANAAEMGLAATAGQVQATGKICKRLATIFTRAAPGQQLVGDVVVVLGHTSLLLGHLHEAFQLCIQQRVSHPPKLLYTLKQASHLCPNESGNPAPACARADAQ